MPRSFSSQEIEPGRSISSPASSFPLRPRRRNLCFRPPPTSPALAKVFILLLVRRHLYSTSSLSCLLFVRRRVFLMELSSSCPRYAVGVRVTAIAWGLHPLRHRGALWQVPRRLCFISVLVELTFLAIDLPAFASSRIGSRSGVVRYDKISGCPSASFNRYEDMFDEDDASKVTLPAWPGQGCGRHRLSSGLLVQFVSCPYSDVFDLLYDLDLCMYLFVS
nr:uncharacterized protein LOC127336637 [Lolium perenne]